jgi:hypothetical protein
VHCQASCLVTVLLVRPFTVLFQASRLAPAATTSADFSLPRRSAFGFAAASQNSHKARSPQVREHDPSPHSRRIYVAWPLATRASQSLACSPWPAPPQMQFVYLDSRFTLHASSPRSVALTQLRFTCLAVASSAEDLHLQDRAHAGRTSAAIARAMASICNDEWAPFGVMSGHVRMTLSLTGRAGPLPSGLSSPRGLRA